MKRTMIKDVNSGSEKVVVKGWVQRIRKMKSIVFIILRDRTGLIQCVVEKEVFNESNVGLESVISITGNIVTNVNALGDYEIQVEAIDVLSRVNRELPIQVNKEELNIQLDTLLKNRVLALRHEKENLIFKIQTRIAQLFQSFFVNKEFTEIHTPKLVKEGAEGGANVFQLEYFGKQAYLAQSPQFYKQMMVIAGMEQVFEIGPVFRAEQHSSNRHLNEYISMDMEMGFISSEMELMSIENELLIFIIERLKIEFGRTLNAHNIELPEVPKEIPIMTYNDVVNLLKNQYNVSSEDGDLNPEGERVISDHIFRETGSEFIFISAYPKKKRPMYAMPNGNLTNSFDLLFRGLEITTGGLRIHELDMLIESMKFKGLNPDNYQSYLESFKYGAPPHGGFAIGLERLTTQLLGLDNVRRTSLFPRDMDRLTP